jgi:hypothetical protein
LAFLKARRRVALLVAVCALAAGGVIAAYFTNDVHESAANVPPTVTAPTTAAAPTTTAPPTTGAAPKPAPVVTTGVAPTDGAWTPITVKRPKVPIIAGGIPVDVDPTTSRSDFSTTLFRLGPNRYRLTIFNTSTLGAITSLQWYPPTGVRILKLLGSSAGHCTLTGLAGFGGNQFPTLVLYPNILCEKLDLNAATCICRGDGGSVAISFITNGVLPVDGGDLRLRTASVAFDRIPLSPTASHSVRHVRRIVTASVGSGGLGAAEREAAQTALDALQDSNISLQLTTITTRWAQNRPATCRVGLVSRSPNRFKVYLFWVPWLAAEPYIWLNMSLTGDPRTSMYSLGTTQPVLPGGRLTRNGRKVNRLSVDTTLLSRYGPEQAKKGHEILVAHAGDVLTQPGATCEVLKNGSLRLLPS